MSSNLELLLRKAAQSGNLTQVQAILAQGANVDATDRDGTTALMFAAHPGYTEIVRALLEAGANVNLRRKQHGLTALMLAAAANQVDV
ncbi:MAG TPA: ankyrin repeat domain-containing protein, partial [Oculatellaceae cyanobacterium]